MRVAARVTLSFLDVPYICLRSQWLGGPKQVYSEVVVTLSTWLAVTAGSYAAVCVNAWSNFVQGVEQAHGPFVDRGQHVL